MHHSSSYGASYEPSPRATYGQAYGLPYHTHQGPSYRPSPSQKTTQKGGFQKAASSSGQKMHPSQRLFQAFKECAIHAEAEDYSPSPVSEHSGLTPLYVSLDVEYDGITPVWHSMRSMGIAAFQDGIKEPVDQFYVTIKPQKGCHPDPECIRKFWGRHPDQWKEVNTNACEPALAMELLNQWLRKLRLQGYVLKWVAGPANNDWKWLDFYWHKYGPSDKEDIGFFCHDISSLNRGYIIQNNITDKKRFREAITEEKKYTHRAIDDAVCQGTMYMNLRRLLSKEARQKKSFVELFNGKPMLVTVTVQPLHHDTTELYVTPEEMETSPPQTPTTWDTPGVWTRSPSGPYSVPVTSVSYRDVLVSHD